MARETTRRNYVRRPGLTEAAAALGSTYSHLVRVVSGDRISRSLMLRYRAWRKAQRAAQAEEISKIKAQLPAVMAHVTRAANFACRKSTKAKSKS